MATRDGADWILGTEPEDDGYAVEDDDHAVEDDGYAVEDDDCAVQDDDYADMQAHVMANRGQPGVTASMWHHRFVILGLRPEDPARWRVS